MVHGHCTAPSDLVQMWVWSTAVNIEMNLFFKLFITSVERIKEKLEMYTTPQHPDLANDHMG